MENNAERLLENVKSLVNESQIPNAERYMSNVMSFLNQCTDDAIFEKTTVQWDSETSEIDFLWDTTNFDCRFSIGLLDARWSVWVGINNHSKDDKRYSWGVGGDRTDDEEFALGFFGLMKDEFDDGKK